MIYLILINNKETWELGSCSIEKKTEKQYRKKYMDIAIFFRNCILHNLKQHFLFLNDSKHPQHNKRDVLLVAFTKICLLINNIF